MVQEQRLSAVAKRRRLNESSPQEPVTSTPALVPDLTRSVRSKDRPASTADAKNVSNSFQPLAGRDLVKFHSVRTVALVDASKIKVSLSRGQQCLVCGRCFLWVRQGTISVLGAVLNSLTPAQRIYHPENEDIPAIVCLTDGAEFQLESDPVPIPWLPQEMSSMYDWTVPGQDAPISVSFVLDGMKANSRTLQQPAKTYQLKSLDVHYLKAISEILANASGSGSTPERVVLCGKWHPAITKISTAILNHLLTTQRSDDGTHLSKGSLLLDIDLQTPGYSPPGTVSLVQVREPVLVPSYTRNVYMIGAHSVLAMRYFDNAKRAIEVQETFEGLLARLLEEINRSQNFPVIVNGWDLFSYARDDYVESFKHNVMPTRIICFGDETTSSGRFGSLLAKSAQVPFHMVDCIAATMPLVADVRRLGLQSYFGQTRLFHEDGIALKTRNPMTNDCIRLSYGPDCESAQIIAFDISKHNDIVNRLLGSRVAILLETVNMNVNTREERPALRVGTTSKEQQDIQHSNSYRGDHQKTMRICRTRSEGLPVIDRCRAISDPNIADKDCIGLGTIVHVNVSDSFVHIITPVPPETFRSCLTRGLMFRMVASYP